MEGVFIPGFLGLTIILPVILFLVGLVLRRRGVLKTRGAMIGWFVLCILPLAIGLLIGPFQQATEDSEAGALKVEGPMSTTRPQPEHGNGI